MPIILSIAAMACTVIATLVMLVLFIAGTANSSPEQLRSMKLWSGSLTVLAVVCVVAGIFLMRGGQLGWAAGVSFLPTIVMSIAFAIALLK